MADRPESKQITLSDVITELTPQQVRRIVAIFGLTVSRERRPALRKSA
jgi:16S rRNA U516 pseudouridylate synthase RsuA-like enzyme